MSAFTSAPKAPWDAKASAEGWSFSGVDSQRPGGRCQSQAVDLCGSSSDDDIDDVEMLATDNRYQAHDHTPGSRQQGNALNCHTAGPKRPYESNASQTKRAHSNNGLQQAEEDWDAKKTKMQHGAPEYNRMPPKVVSATGTHIVPGEMSSSLVAVKGARKRVAEGVMHRNAVVSSTAQPFAAQPTQSRPSSTASNQGMSPSQVFIKQEDTEYTAGSYLQPCNKPNSIVPWRTGSQATPIFLEDSDDDGDYDDHSFAPLPVLTHVAKRSHTYKPPFSQPTAEQRLATKAESDRLRQENIAKKGGLRANSEAQPNPKAGMTPIIHKIMAAVSTATSNEVRKDTSSVATSNRPRSLHVSSSTSSSIIAPPSGHGRLATQQAPMSLPNNSTVRKPSTASLNSLLRTIDDSKRQLPTSFGAKAPSELTRAGNSAKPHVVEINRILPQNASPSSQGSQVHQKELFPPRQPQTQRPQETPAGSLHAAQRLGTNNIEDEQAAARRRQYLAAKARAEHDAKRERDAAAREARKAREELHAIEVAKRRRSDEQAAFNERLKAQEKEAEEVQKRNSSFAALMSVASQKSETASTPKGKPPRVEPYRPKSPFSDFQGASSTAEAQKAKRIQLVEERNARRRQAEAAEAARRRRTASPDVVVEPAFTPLPRAIPPARPTARESISSPATTGPVSLNSVAGRIRLAKAKDGTSGTVLPEDLWLLEQHFRGIPYADLIEPCAKFYGKRRDEKWLSRRWLAVKGAIVHAGVPKDLVERLKTGDAQTRAELHHLVGLEVLGMADDDYTAQAQPRTPDKSAARESRPAASNKRTSTYTSASNDSDTLAEDIRQALEDDDAEAPDERPTHSGKSLGGAALEHYAQILAESWEEEHEQSEAGREFRAFINREPSPFDRADYCHWVYQIARREISRDAIEAGEDIDGLPWDVCKVDFEDREEANDAAHIEGAKFLDPASRNCALYSGSTVTNRYDGDGMITTRLEVENGGIVEARVVRYSRTREDGVLPSNKEGWAPTTIYIAKQEVVVQKLGDGMFEEALKTDTTGVVDNKIFTDYEMANEWAARQFVKLTYRPTTSHLNKRDEEIRAQVENWVSSLNLETAQLFDQRSPREGDSFTRVWVEKGQLLGPRN